MRSYFLDIAGYVIHFKSVNEGLDIFPSLRFTHFIVDDASAYRKKCLDIDVRRGRFSLPDDAKLVFDAPYVEEIEGSFVKKSDRFWSVWTSNGLSYIKVSYPSPEPIHSEAVLQFSPSDSLWNLWIDTEESTIDPMMYPLDGLILYYLTVVYGDLMIHSSGIELDGCGFLFSGVSGRGKTTMSRLWEAKGAMVVHDDRLIVRKIDGAFMMFNTPVYDNEQPRVANLDYLFLIEHGVENIITPLQGVEALSGVISNCMQHNWSTQMVSSSLAKVADLCSCRPVFKLAFKPDDEVVPFIRNYIDGR